jgi:HAE1 family hydrophobic/amphiphilic exporter-1
MLALGLSINGLTMFGLILVIGIVGRLYRPFAITISVATLFSSINALTLSPALCGMLLRPSRERTKGFFGLFNRALRQASSGYQSVVGGLLRKAVIGGAVFAAMLVAAWLGVTALPTGFVPPEDEGYFMISVQLPDAASLGRTQEVMNEVSAILADTEGIRGAVVVGGFSLLDSVVAPNAGVSWVVLDHWDERSSPDLHIQAVVASVNRRLATIKGAIAFAVRPPPIQGLGTTGGSQMELQDRGGAGLELLQQVATDIQRQGARHPALGGVNTTLRAGVPQLFLEVDREKARRLDVPLNVIFSTLQANLGSAYVNDFNLFGRVWRVLLQADEPFRLERADITRLEVRSNSGRMVPLATLLEVRDTVGPTVESRYNLFPSASLIGGPGPGHSSGEAMAAMEQLARNYMPPSMGFEWTGVAFQERAAGGAAALIFALALVFVYLFLAAQYESWSLPLSVLLTVPAAVLGAAALTLVRGLDNNVYFQIGLVLLIGLSSKSAILIVEFANQLANEGRTPFEAAIEAATLRFRAILMTALSFILGVIPLVVATGAGAASRVSLGTAVFGGMLFATVGGLIITPFLFYLVRRLSSRSAAATPTPTGTGSAS